MKTYKTAAILLIAATVILSSGFGTQISAGKELKSRIGEISSIRNECAANANQATQILEACATRFHDSEKAAYGKYETWVNVTSAIFVFGVILLMGAIVTPFSIMDRNENEALRKEFVRMRVTSFQRRARLAKRELAMRQLELARS